MIKPKKLCIGDRISIFAGSAPDGAKYPRRFRRAIENLTSIGFQVDIGNALSQPLGYLAGTIKDRAESFNQMVFDPQITCIMSCIGGNNINGILDQIDYTRFSSSPKILVGYSDFSALLLAVYAKTGCITFHGPALMPQFGEADGIDPYTLNNFLKTTGDTGTIGEIKSAYSLIDEFLEWDVMDYRPRLRQIHHGAQVIREGSATGLLICSNVSILLALHGTQYLPDLTNSILCIEESEEADASMLEFKLTALRQKSVFDNISGLVLGKLTSSTKFISERNLTDVLIDVLGDFDFPIATDFDFGHTDPQLTLPIGIKASLDCASTYARLSILDSAVTTDIQIACRK